MTTRFVILRPSGRRIPVVGGRVREDGCSYGRDPSLTLRMTARFVILRPSGRRIPVVGSCVPVECRSADGILRFAQDDTLFPVILSPQGEESRM